MFNLLFFNRKIIKFFSFIVKILKFIAFIGQSDIDFDLDHMTITFFYLIKSYFDKMPQKTYYLTEKSSNFAL